MISPSILKTLVGLGALLGALYILQLVNGLVYAYRARARGCEPPHSRYYFPLGIPDTIRKVQSFNNDVFLQTIEAEAKAHPEHRTIRQQVMGDMWIVTYDPENIKAILASSFKDYSLGFRWNAFFKLLGNGVFTLSGDGWKHSRALLRPQFSREQVTRMKSLSDHINLLVARLEKRATHGKTVDVQALYHLLTMDTATEFLFGRSADTLSEHSRGVDGPDGFVTGQQFADSFSQCLYTLAMRLFLGPVYFLADSFKFRRNIKVCHNFVDHFVNKALERPMEKSDQAPQYIFINELTKETRDAKAIRDQAFNILLAGRDTTASLLSYITFYLGKHKDVLAQLRQAVLSEFGDTEDAISFESLKRCRYMQNVINEVLRLHPIVPVNFRTAIRDTILPTGGGKNFDKPVFVPKDTNILYPVNIMQRDHTLWGKDANEFRPDRWDESTISHTWDFLPFNGGPRICLGQQFALTETSFVLVRLLQTFKDITVIHPDPPTTNPTNMKQWMRLTSSVAGGVIATFTPADC